MLTPLDTWVFADVPVGRGVPSGVHAGPVGAGEAEGAAHTPWGRRGRTGLQSRCGGTGPSTPSWSRKHNKREYVS